MSAYVYALIPYKNEKIFNPEEGEISCPYPNIPELKGIQSELTESDGLYLFKDFVLVNTCYRLSSFTRCEDGFCWLRAEIYKIAKALGANEVWYAEELATDEMYEEGFSFDNWKAELHTSNRKYTQELTIDVLKSDSCYSYYHDDFSDIVLKV